MVRRSVKIASGVCFAMCGVLIALWVRSYHDADRIHGPLWQRSFLVASKQGRITAVAFRRWPGDADAWTLGFHTFPVDDEMSFPLGSVRQYEATLGFGSIANPTYMLTRSTFETPPGATILISGAAVLTLRGSGVLVPFWFLVLVSAILGVALRMKRPWRYTTRSLLIAFTFVAMLLGLVAWLDNSPDPWQLDIPAPLDEL